MAYVACTTTVQESLSEDEANVLVGELQRYGISSRKEHASDTSSVATYAVVTSDDDFSQALSIANQLAIRSKESRVYQSVKDRELVSTPGQESMRMLSALAEDLSDSVRLMGGVLAAKVHISSGSTEATTLPTTPALNAVGGALKASVIVKLKHDAAELDVEKVRALLSGSIAGLDAARVTVVQIKSAAPVRRMSPWVRVGPFTVSKSSAGSLRTLIAITLSLNILLVVVFMRERIRGSMRVAARQPN